MRIADRRFHFDIPAQSLEAALAAYVAVTGVETIYNSDLLGARKSTAVKGVLAPDIALRVLLEGSGLSEVSTGNAFAVVDAPRGQRYGGARLTDFGPYYSTAVFKMVSPVPSAAARKPRPEMSAPSSAFTWDHPANCEIPGS